MSDNVTQLNTDNQPTPRLPAKKLVILAAIAVFVCAIVALFLFKEKWNLDSVKRWGKYLNVRNDENFGRYSFDSHGSNCYENFDDGLAVASIGGLIVFNEAGQERFALQQPIELPQMLVSDQMAVAYDVGGTALIALDKQRGEVLRLEETHPILDADLSRSGMICLSSSAGGYKSVLSVYNEEQDLIYRWLSSSAYYPLCAVAPSSNRIAAISVGQADGEFESSICMFETDQEQIVDQFRLGSELFYDLIFTQDDALCAVGENALHFVSIDGKEIGTYAYRDGYLKDFTHGGDGFLTLSTNMYRAGNRYSLTTVNEKGREIATRYLGQEVLDLSACGKYIAVLTQGKLTIYTPSLSVYHEATDVVGVTSVVMRADGTALLIGNGQGTLYIP